MAELQQQQQQEEEPVIQYRCIAMNKTDLRKRCKKAIHKNSNLFCTIHNKKNPALVAIGPLADNNMNDIWNSTRFIDEDTYTLENDQAFIDYERKKEEDERIYRETILQEVIEKEQRLASITSCKVCLDNELLNSDLIRCTNADCDNKHLVCVDCMKGHIDSLISNGMAGTVCIFDKSDKCKGEYSPEIIENVLTLTNPEIKDKWAELVHIGEITKMASICDDYVICPLCCKWGCIFEIPAGVMINFYIPCGGCSRSWCNVCKRPAHEGRTCYKLEFHNEESREKRCDIIDHMIQEIVTKSLTHCCSTCGCSYIKEEGCNLMICPKCDSMSCYLCNMKLYYKNNTKYWHFAGHELSDPDAQCRLWNNDAGDGKVNQGNLEFNQKAIETELIKFTKANHPGNVGELICERIIHTFVKDVEYKKIVTIFTDMLKLYRGIRVK